MQPAGAAAEYSVTGLPSRERVRAFELAAGLSVLFMMLIHDLWHWGKPETWTSTVGWAISLAGGPTATPTFLFVMGASLAFVPPWRFATLASRGLWLLFLGYLLNFLRGTLPAVVGTSVGLVTWQQIAPFTPWSLLTSVDLHHVAGLSLIAAAAIRVRWRPGWPWLAVAAGVVLLQPWLRGLSFGIPILDGPLTPILGGASNVFYAVIPWLAYALIGAVFGRILATASDQRRVFRLGGLVGLGLCAISLPLIALTGPSFDVITYWHGPPAFVIGIIGLVLLWLAACEAVTRIEWLNRRLRIVYFWSARVIPMYFTHWLVVGWGIAVVGFRDLDLTGVLIATPCGILVTTLLSRFAVGLEEAPWRIIARRVDQPIEGGRPEPLTADA
jgi:uncharacterized membrane protein